MRATLIRFALACALVFAFLPASEAMAGGFYLLPRGSGPLGRGGAVVAGADDPHANWYNPAGLAYSGDQLLLDATLTLFETQFTRIDSGGNTLPTVTGYHPYLPIPTVGGSFSIDELPEWTFSIVAMAPNAALMDWPQGPDAPQRYSVLTLQGSLLASVSAGVAWRPIKELSIGFATHLIVGSFNATVALSACDGVICSFPEDPEHDAVANLSLPVVYPFFVLGTIVDLDIVRIGASVSTPYNLEGQARIRVRPPSASSFSGAEVVNRRPGCNWEDPSAACRDDTVANVLLRFPWILRLGVEVRPIPELRIELAGVYETWSVQDQAIIDPQDTWIQNALGGGLEYQVGPLSIPRNMKDTISVRLGGAYTIEQVVTARLGWSFETGSFSDQFLSPLTIDSDKMTFSGGVTIDASAEVAIDIVGGYLWMASRSVRDSMVPQSNPIRPPGSVTEAVFVGNGDYSMGAPFFGLGVRWRLDAGHIRGPGTEPVEPVEPDAVEEPDAPDETEAGATGEGSTVAPGTPWYQQGATGTGATGAGATGTSADEPPPSDEPAAEEPPEDAPPPRRRRRRRRPR